MHTTSCCREIKSKLHDKNEFIEKSKIYGNPRIIATHELGIRVVRHGRTKIILRNVHDNYRRA